jgi:hypothetical protein
MSLRILPVALVLAGAAPGLAQEWGGTQYGMRQVPTLVGTWYAESEFDIGSGRGEWDDDSYRVDLEWRFSQGRQGRIEPFATGYLAWDDRSASEGSTEFDYEAFVFGIGGGAFVYLGGDGGGKLDLALVPWTRIGMGFQDGSVNGLRPSADLEMEGDVGDLRFELALGVDAAMFIGEKLMVTGGVGFQLWTSSRATYVTLDENDDVVVEEDIELDGNEVLVRLGAGVLF